MKRFLIFVSCVLAILVAAVLFYFHGRRYDLTISQGQIDKALQARYPITKKLSENSILTVQATYSNPRVRLLPDANRIEVGLDAELELHLLNRTEKLRSGATATTGLIYRPETQQFFLADPQITQLTFLGMPQNHVDTVKDLAMRVAKNLPRQGLAADEIANASQFAATVAGEYLQQFPVYTLKAKDVKSAAAKMVIKNVEVRNHEIHVTLGL